MAKEIKMDYEEYEAMLSMIKDQDKAIQELKKESKVVLIRLRHGYGMDDRFNPLACSVPDIVTTDELFAKEYLQSEFDEASKKLRDAEFEIRMLRQKKFPVPERKKSWWARNSFNL